MTFLIPTRGITLAVKKPNEAVRLTLTFFPRRPPPVLSRQFFRTEARRRNMLELRVGRSAAFFPPNQEHLTATLKARLTVNRSTSELGIDAGDVPAPAHHLLARIEMRRDRNVIEPALQKPEQGLPRNL